MTDIFRSASFNLNMAWDQQVSADFSVNTPSPCAQHCLSTTSRVDIANPYNMGIKYSNNRIPVAQDILHLRKPRNTSKQLLQNRRVDIQIILKGRQNLRGEISLCLERPDLIHEITAII